MAHITLSIPDGVYKEMKKHPEIKWSEVARQNILERVRALKKSIHSKELFNLLPPDTKKRIEEVDEKEWVYFYKKAKKQGWKRTTYLTQV